MTPENTLKIGNHSFFSLGSTRFLKVARAKHK